ncbi:MAG: LysM peptidoglycan-binding domain-containing protein [Pseudobutyrivibrio sp.]|nr:LysM peptidoglycan-binding domain-containing protein [Pseudobutyrivibrio sp.]
MTRGEIIVRNRRISLVIVAFVAIIISLVFFSTRASATNSREIYTCYESYEIQPGDTLWTIADDYLTVEDSDKDDFIARTKALNHMVDDDITAGNYIVVEYQSYFDK